MRLATIADRSQSDIVLLTMFTGGGTPISMRMYTIRMLSVAYQPPVITG